MDVINCALNLGLIIIYIHFLNSNNSEILQVDWVNLLFICISTFIIGIVIVKLLDYIIKTPVKHDLYVLLNLLVRNKSLSIDYSLGYFSVFGIYALYIPFFNDTEVDLQIKVSLLLICALFKCHIFKLPYKQMVYIVLLDMVELYVSTTLINYLFKNVVIHYLIEGMYESRIIDAIQSTNSMVEIQKITETGVIVEYDDVSVIFKNVIFGENKYSVLVTTQDIKII